uniref:Uncharacterized protein n=1 Tax=Anguilla anguilla TaxID=7936 RepID=A0A0E9XRK2_ANGAN
MSPHMTTKNPLHSVINVSTVLNAVFRDCILTIFDTYENS